MHTVRVEDRDRIRVHTVSNRVMVRFSVSIMVLWFITQLSMCSYYTMLAMCIASFIKKHW